MNEQMSGIENQLAESDELRSLPSVAEVVQTWREKFDQGTLNESHFKEHWRFYVPQVLSLNPNGSCLDHLFDADNVQNILFTPLEEFICGGNPNEEFERIKQLDEPPSVCGRVFKPSEPTYNCRECSTDPTCVLCVECFKKSEHCNHKYKISTSSGGGCCDCGDIEAWKKHPYCSVHLVGTLEEVTKNCPFPEDMQNRTKITFKAILRYSYQLLSIDHEPMLPKELRLQEVADDPLSCLDAADIYCTVLYNDETHTFDHVIGTLTKVIRCSQRDAIDYVTSIDREGRAVVKCSTFQYCSELKTEVERFTARSTSHPLKVQVKHSHVVAHQLYAIKLLSWFQKILMNSKHFREIFVQVVMEKKSDQSILEGILQRDSILWKSARMHWHRLFISGMLKEYDNKKKFAITFTKNYTHIMKDFIRDDHDHNVSIAALGVQIYTVRTISHYLIAEHDVLMVLLNTFWSECGSYLKDGKFEFQRNEHSSAVNFKRAQYILYDLHYLLSSIPEEWTNELRCGFGNGLLNFVKLLSAMQGMDSVKRQVGQHMEYEPEWENAFNLHIKLSAVFNSMIQWCGSDKTVLIKSYRATLRKLCENPCPCLKDVGVVREIADHSTTCINYDVSDKPVSIHLPLSRFLAGLHVQLEKHGLNFYSDEFNSITKQTPEQIIEPVLRTQVMIAQVHAGLWRRNGYSILHQTYFYHNVRCRNEMLNNDIILLQYGASLIESNDFLIHLLNKYRLIEWADEGFEALSKRNEEDGLRQITMLVEEFLALLINIVSERYMLGIGKVTEKDCIKKEIIQQLCMKPLSHSELSRTLSEYNHHDMNIDSVIDEIATFQKPVSGTGKGLFKLKPEYHDQYNVFFYHYTKEELSRSEEAQRRRARDEGFLDCCPPPVLPALTTSFNLLVNLLQCDVMLYIMKLVLTRAGNLQTRSFSEAQLHRTLYLIGLALNEEQSRLYDYFVFTERCEKLNILKCLEDLYKSARIEVYKDFIKWTINKYKKVAAVSRKLREKKNLTTLQDEEQMDVEEKEINVTNEESEDNSEYTVKMEKERIAKMAAERRRKLLAQIMCAQKTFIKENAKQYEEATSADKSKTEEICWKNVGNVEFPVALGPQQTSHVNADPTYTCILCQEHQSVSSNAPAMVFGAHVQKSSVLKSDFKSAVQNMKPENLFFLCSSLTSSVFINICGHVMHSTCWDKYFQNLSTKESRRTYRLRQPTSFDIEKEEFLCPLCESLNNSILPVLPPLGNVVGAVKLVVNEDISFEAWLLSLIKATERKQQEISERKRWDSKRPKKAKKQNDDRYGNVFDLSINSHDDESMVTGEGGCPSPTSNTSTLWTYNKDSDMASVFLGYNEEMEILLLTNPGEISNVHKPVLSDSVRNMVGKFTKSVCSKGLALPSPMDEDSCAVLCWESCAYTIHVVEVLLRYGNRSLLGDMSTRQKKCIKSLIRLSAMQEICRNKRAVNSYALMVLCLIFDRNYMLNDACIMDWDPFGILVSLVMSLPSLLFMQTPAPLPSGSILDLYAAKLMLIATVSQILIGGLVPFEVGEANTEDTECLRLYLTVLNENKWQKVDTVSLWKRITDLTLHFLRCSCIFFRYLTGVQPPECLKTLAGDTYENMCKYLGLPTTCSELLHNESTLEVFRSWVTVWRRQQTVQHVALKFESYFSRRGLITLPKDYSELVNSVSSFTCPNSDREDLKTPTLCLVCGKMLCSTSYCCQAEVNGTSVGACTYHAYECGSGCGIFLRIRECEILLLSCPNRGCFLVPPYLDEYGETDQGLRRGNPLKLCEDRYKKLENIWLSHSIHEEVSRSLESNHSLTITQWSSL